MNLAPIPLIPGGRYEWRLWINGETDDNWRLPFSVAKIPPHLQQQIFGAEDDKGPGEDEEAAGGG